MRQTISLICVMGVLETGSVAAPALPPRVQKSIVGEWIAESVTFNGKEITSDVRQVRYTFSSDGTWVRKQPQQGEDHDLPLEYSTDSEADPKTIDLLIGPARKDRPACAGIYKVEGDRLILCYPSRPGQSRPTDFESSVG